MRRGESGPRAWLGFCSSIFLLSGCEQYDPNADLLWQEPVTLASGETVQVQRHVVFRQERAMGGGFSSAPVYITSTVQLLPASDAFPLWNAPMMPIVLDRDPQNGEWIVVATDDGCEIWSRNGRPRPPYWAFRLRDKIWYRTRIPTDFLNRPANLFVSLSVNSDSTAITKNIVRLKVLEKEQPIAPYHYRKIDEADLRCDQAPSEPIGQNEMDLKRFRSLP